MIHSLTAEQIPCCPALPMPFHPAAEDTVSLSNEPGSARSPCLVQSDDITSYRLTLSQNHPSMVSPVRSRDGQCTDVVVIILSSHMPDLTLALPALTRVSTCSALWECFSFFYCTRELLLMFPFSLGMSCFLTCVSVARGGCSLSDPLRSRSPVRRIWNLLARLSSPLAWFRSQRPNFSETLLPRGRVWSSSQSASPPGSFVCCITADTEHRPVCRPCHSLPRMV